MIRKKIDISSIKPGEKKWGYINVLDSLSTDFDMPVMIINGDKQGPTFSVTAGLFALEECGIEAATRLFQKLEPNRLKGRLIIVPVVNMSVFQFRSPMFRLRKSLTPFDGKDITECFPGNLQGTPTDVLAYRLFNEIILESDFHVDFRGGEIYESHLLHTIHLEVDKPIDKELKKMSQVFGLEYCLPSRPDIKHTSPGTLIYEAVSRNVRSIISESGVGYIIQPMEKFVNAHVEGVCNLLKYFDMLDGTIVKPEFQKYLLPDLVRIKAPISGIFKHIADQGDHVMTGSVIGTICDLDGKVLHEIITPVDAVVHEMLPKRLVYTGDKIYSLGVEDKDTGYIF
jgi:predicted deacylase